MKKLFILLACAATVVACSKDETIASFKGDAIKFGNPFVNKSTRLDTYGVNKDLTSFNVWGTVQGTPIYTGNKVENEEGEWTADAAPQYWADGATYNFAAIADGTAATLEAGLPATIDYTLSNDNDLLYATSGEFKYASGQTEKTVEFTFEHLLSKAKFTVTSDATTGYSHKVHTISVANYTEGTYTVATQKWAVSNDDAQNVAFNDITVDATTTPVVSNEMLLIPVVAGFNVNFTVDFYKGTTKIHSKTYSIPCTDEFKKGHAYNFTIALDAGDEIKFSVNTLPTWKEDPATTPVTLQ